MRTLVTGGAGFIGGHLVDALIARGDSVVVIDKAEPKAERKNAKAEYVKLDINDAGLEAAVLAAKPEVVFHLAAHIDDRASVLDPAFNTQENVKGSLNVFQAAKAAGVKKIIFASTGVAYGQNGAEVMTEDMVSKPVTPYAVSKFAGELYLQFFYKQYGIPYVACRIGNVYGPWQDGSKEVGAIAIFTEKLLKGEVPLMNNDGLTVRDYIYVGDVVAGFLAGADSNEVGVFNLGTGVGTTTADLYAAVASAVGSTIVPDPQPETMDVLKKVTLDSTKLQKAMGWAPKVSLAEGIKLTVDWYKSRV